MMTRYCSSFSSFGAPSVQGVNRSNAPRMNIKGSVHGRLGKRVESGGLCAYCSSLLCKVSTFKTSSYDRFRPSVFPRRWTIAKPSSSCKKALCASTWPLAFLFTHCVLCVKHASDFLQMNLRLSPSEKHQRMPQQNFFPWRPSNCLGFFFASSCIKYQNPAPHVWLNWVDPLFNAHRPNWMSSLNEMLCKYADWGTKWVSWQQQMDFQKKVE